MHFNLIVACDLDDGIGRYGTIPWKNGDDMRFFRLKTTNHIVLMGRKTYESLPGPLHDRLNIVVSKTYVRKYAKLPEIKSVWKNGVLYVKDFLSSIKICKSITMPNSKIETFVIGGSNIYMQALQHLKFKKIYVTKIRGHYDCDSFFDTKLLLQKKKLDDIILPVATVVERYSDYYDENE